MILTVRHVTTYSYQRPMRQLVQSLRLFPSICDSQKVLDWSVTVEGFGDGPARLAEQREAGGFAQSQTRSQAQSGSQWQGQGAAQAAGQVQQQGGWGGSQAALGGYQQMQVSGGQTLSVVAPLTLGLSAEVGACFRDGSGDRTETVSVRGPVDKVVVAVEGRVETQDHAGVLRGLREASVPGIYLRSTRATAPDVALTDLARDVAANLQGQNQLALAHALSAEISARIVYTPGETEAGTTAAEALARGKGVCQDHAHALIAAALVAGVPARYVVGYLATGEAMGEASHAWAELYIDGIGWIGFDPANECCPDDRYIRLCSGYDALDAAPIRGVAMGAEAEALEVDVAVRRQEQ